MCVIYVVVGGIKKKIINQTANLKTKVPFKESPFTRRPYFQRLQAAFSGIQEFR